MDTNIITLPPWVIYANQIEAMFKEDKDIKVEYNDLTSSITIRVKSIDKADAISQLLPEEFRLGNVVITISVVPENEAEDKSIDLFRRAFDGNPAISEIVSVDTIHGPINFVVFKPKIVQYYNDNMQDLNGLCTTVYQDLAKKLFGDNDRIFYCTEKIEDMEV